MTSTRDQLRAQMRSLRRRLPLAARREAARSFVRFVDRSRLLTPSKRIALYCPFGHEADPACITRRAWQVGCEVYLPVITHRRCARMEFFRFDPGSPLRINVFGIPEPPRDARKRIAVQGLDIVFMPLVAFDDQGSRLGSGAGYYDRCLKHLSRPRRWRRPKLIGIAYAQQRVDRLDRSPWDVPMDAVITQRGLERFVLNPRGSAR